MADVFYRIIQRYVDFYGEILVNNETIYSETNDYLFEFEKALQNRVYFYEETLNNENGKTGW